MPLAEGFARVDARGLADDLRLTFAMAQQLHLPQVGQDLGTRRWSEMLDADDIFLLAEAAAHDSSQPYQDSLHITDAGTLKTHAKTIDDLLKDWITRAKAQKHKLGVLPARAQDTAGFDLLATRLSSATADNPKFERFLDSLLSVQPEGAMPSLASDLRASTNTPLDPNYLRFSSISTRVQGLNQMAEQALEELNHSLATRADHPPHVGLLLAFFDLQAVLRARLNRLPDQFLDHYYGQVLGQSPRPAKAGTLPLAFSLAPGQSRAFIPAGAQVELRRGPGALLERLQTREDLEVQDVAVEKLCATLANRGDGAQLIRMNVKTLRRRQTAVAADGTANFNLHRRTPYLPEVLWQTQNTFLSLSLATDAFAHPCRVEACTITIVCETLSDGIKETPQTVAEEAFEVSLDQADGFTPLPVAKAEITGSMLTITLGSDNAPILESEAGLGSARLRIKTVFDLDLEKDADTRSVEHLRIWTLRHQVKHVTLTTRYKGLKPTSISAAGEPAELGAPFALFGPQPKRGATLDLRHPFLTTGTVEEFALHLDWASLPEVLFEQYYAGYAGDFHTDTFKVAILDYKGQPWRFDDVTKVAALFRPDGRGSIAPRSTFRLNPPEAKEPPTLLRLRLDAPSQGFGADLFAATLTSYVADTQTFKSRIKRVGGAIDAPPNPPYTPELEGIGIDMTHTMVHGPQGDLQVHYAFGAARVGALPTPLTDLAVLEESPSDSNADVLAQFEICVGLSPTAPGKTLRLFAQIDPRTASARSPNTTAGPPNPVWFYLTQKGWNPVSLASGLVDGTRGLSRTGSIALRMPEDASPQGPAMPQGLVWLAARWPSVDIAQVGRLTRLTCNAVDAAPMAPPATASRHSPNPADWTLRLVDTGISGKIAGLIPVGKWRGTRPAEAPATVRARVSERMAHRGRAILAADYENLVLAAFPELSDARLVQTAPGHVTVVVTAKREAGALPPPLAPDQLDEIWRMLAGRCAVDPARLTVRGAEFEVIQVVGDVTLVPGATAQTWLAVSQQISAWMAPWITDPTLPVAIGGQVDLGALEGRLASHPQVADVAWLGVSRLSDAIIDPGEAEPNLLYLQRMRDATRRPNFVRSSCPWGLLVPTEQHILDHANPERAWPARRLVGPASLLPKTRDLGLKRLGADQPPSPQTHPSEETGQNE